MSLYQGWPRTLLAKVKLRRAPFQFDFLKSGGRSLLEIEGKKEAL
jgi:hypothetical protein